MYKFALLALISTFNLAATFEFVGPCERAALFETQMQLDNGATVGSATIKLLNTYQIPHKGTQRGMNSIFDTPTGIDAMEVLSDTQMNAHGWCYSVNGLSPEVYPNEVELKDNDHVMWWFGYAHYDSGKWITQCEPTWKRAPAQFCN
ncbi:hypothetical protein BALOs_1004 [Halobacteriovorax sp. BALOs_7]|uniref:DUF4430 domain-containing protein n=1 Tax=Halobacteriovorax vibrionivorans TaxID=2152716 RepID=A0ABY0IIS9_9BACT|nr:MULTISPECIES: DUF4430 domain-containing protein [Halobacteriovorax]AYF44014.1 hypothetical protein BALOs_1004 [Halobacteriovorax sp. BALOs_7]RZF21459.1 DUF4430 domain-containing protein [Halobacteriovorax vibrionivorans]TGD48732.1 DUF4430 domain-containing protein [Halobacteriovorax sp. Y22]